MKRKIFLICAGTMLLALPAWSAPNKGKRPAASHATGMRGGGHAAMHAPAGARMASSHSVARSSAPHVTHQNARATGRNNAIVNRDRAVNPQVRENRVIADRNANARVTNNPRLNRTTNPSVAVNRAGVTAARTVNAPIVNNWRSGQFSGQNYAAFRDYHRQWHNQSWWNNNYSRIILVGGGWWYWNAGYWYPAWGYDSSYSYYPYDGPIYGYGDLTPDQVIVNVQMQLRDNGYYVGAVDGVLGRQTRRALAAFQADHGLAVTSSVDRPTLATLGLS